MRIALCLLSLVLAACPKNPETNEMKNSDPQIKPADTVTLVGQKSRMIMQSPISSSMGPDGKQPEMWYLDINGEPGRQVTLYSEKEPSCPGDIEVIGRPKTVIASKGGQDQTFTQYDVVSWRCL